MSGDEKPLQSTVKTSSVCTMRLFNQMETHLTAAVSCRSTCNLTVLQLHSFFFFFNLSSVYHNNYCPLDLWQCDYWTEILIFPHHLRECFIAGEQPPERTCTHGNLGCSLNNRYEVCDLHVNGKDESLQLINVITIPQEECTCWSARSGKPFRFHYDGGTKRFTLTKDPRHWWHYVIFTNVIHTVDKNVQLSLERNYGKCRKVHATAISYDTSREFR